jgi:hypothetical protein
MNITIKTTEKKLSKSLLSQMTLLSIQEMDSQYIEVLGCVVNILKDAPQTALLKVGDDYRLLPLCWVKEMRSIRRPVQKPKRCIVYFENDEQLESWWDKYRMIKDKCRNNQVFI